MTMLDCNIASLLQVIKDYDTPPQKEFSRGLEAELQPLVAFLDCCRPLSVSMTNALRFITWQLTQLPNSVSDSEVHNVRVVFIFCYYSGSKICKYHVPLPLKLTYKVKSVSNASRM
jgi:translation initiation factor 2B subunit (eIF-2B alpha/beta/delta family)